ncbi:MFS transporter [uncultured Nitratireductor sp.]|mgnify:CR=1 FL=1|uniref:MFS transporter n=1 Tax=uncultured Nitratireductor sp. TaxID=520953 RepID=UPI0025F977EE|nr:MFS transporter [uncultured Nitratireductor sp.]
MQGPCEIEPGLALEAESAAERTFCPRSRRSNVLFAAILASALGFIDGSVVSVAMPAMRADLDASLADAQWISNAYALTLAALILVGGSAGDKFGLRKTFIAGIVLFILASMVCAAAPSADALIMARGVQGIGAAFMVPGSLAIIAKAYPRAERGKAIGIWAASSALTTAIGPVFGGLLLSAFGDAAWRVIFAINLPLGALAIAMLLRVPPDRPAGDRKLDLIGAILATIAFGAMSYGLTASSADSPGEGGASGAMVPVAFGLCVLGGFVVWERSRKEPMIDLSLFAILPFSGANVATFVLYFALSGILFYLPMLLIAGWGLDEATTAFIFLPLSLAIAGLSGPVGRLSDAVGPRLPITAGSFVVALAFGGLAFISGSGIHRFWLAAFPMMVLMGLGMALVVSPLSTAVMTSVRDEDTGAASGINNAISRIAGLMAVAAMGTFAAYRYAGALGSRVETVPGFGEPAGGALPDTLEAARVSASDAAFSGVAWVMCAFCLASALVAWFTQQAKGKEPVGATGLD